MDLTSKPLGQPIAGENPDLTITCPVCGHRYGLYAHALRIDFCKRCERKKAQAGDREANKRLWRFNDLYQKAKREAQLAESRAHQHAAVSGPRGARW
jgi:hypothetical protein